MRQFITICAAILITASVFAQAPEKMSYQAVIRNSSNALVADQAVGMRISILQGSTSGTAVYIETQTPTSNTNGLVSLEIGSGTVVSGTFASIDWANGLYFIKTETDPAGGTSYSITGTSQLLSVPYALHARTAESITGTGATPLAIGDSYQGGKIFWLDASGQHGLIVARFNLSYRPWDSGSRLETRAYGSGLYAGAMNTAIIIAVNTESAAKACADYSATENGSPIYTSFFPSLDEGYGDWYLPSIYELYLLSQSGAIGLSDGFYWSSTERNYSSAWGFTSGILEYKSKSVYGMVHPIRAF
jgi:hypothetical protein